jgi:hypothetical protein
MTVLPRDVSRCKPLHPAPRCENCKRWVDHPEQVIGSIVSMVNTTGPKDKACMYVPISLMGAV